MQAGLNKLHSRWYSFALLYRSRNDCNPMPCVVYDDSAFIKQASTEPAACIGAVTYIVPWNKETALYVLEDRVLQTQGLLKPPCTYGTLHDLAAESLCSASLN